MHAPYPPHSSLEQGLRRVARDQPQGTQDLKGQRRMHKYIVYQLYSCTEKVCVCGEGDAGIDKKSYKILDLFYKRSS